MQQYWVLIYIMAAIMMVNGSVQDLHVSVTPVQSRFTAAQDVSVVLKYSNKGGDSISIYKWYVPENGQLWDPLFEITRDGQPVEYVGPLVKRRAPTADDVITLTPGKIISAAVQVSSVYNMTQSGNYIIKYKMNAGQVLFTMNKTLKHRMMSSIGEQEYVLQSAPAKVFAVGRRNLLIEQAIETNSQPKALVPTYSSCSSSHTSAVSTALGAAESYANSVMQYLNTHWSGTPRYTTWFGTYSSTNWLTLKSHFTKVHSVLQSQQLSFDCSCPAATSSTYAYVYSNQPYKIYLCGAYWSAPTTGTDSKGGTIIHELLHFTVVAGTQDYAYGQSSCKSLATSNPTKALANSDSHEYFVENHPTLN